VKLKKALNHFKENPLEENDKVLIKGIFIRHAKDFHDEMATSPLLKRIRLDGNDIFEDSIVVDSSGKNSENSKRESDKASRLPII